MNNIPMAINLAGTMVRPTSLLVFGILNILFAILGLIGLMSSAAMLFGPSGEAGNPVIDVMTSRPGYVRFVTISVWLGIPACILLLVSGIGLLRVRRWGRTLSIGYAVYAVASGLVGIAVNYYMLMEPLLAKAAELPPGPEKAGLIGGAIGGVVGVGFGLIYPTVLLVCMVLPNVKGAFEPVDAELVPGPTQEPR